MCSGLIHLLARPPRKETMTEPTGSWTPFTIFGPPSTMSTTTPLLSQASRELLHTSTRLPRLKPVSSSCTSNSSVPIRVLAAATEEEPPLTGVGAPLCGFGERPSSSGTASIAESARSPRLCMGNEFFCACSFGGAGPGAGAFAAAGLMPQGVIPSEREIQPSAFWSWVSSAMAWATFSSAVSGAGAAAAGVACGAGAATSGRGAAAGAAGDPPGDRHAPGEALLDDGRTSGGTSSGNLASCGGASSGGASSTAFSIVPMSSGLIHQTCALSPVETPTEPGGISRAPYLSGASNTWFTSAGKSSWPVSALNKNTF
mmetsp:Transcript_78101/g.232627  ORF Transcript_78101/g.232627 Transcript_78101/m.232627 type:complete len:315 (+) Transcript_78101:409-1353(+)